MGLSRCSRIIALVVLICACLYGWNCLFGEQRPPCYTVDATYFGSSESISSYVENISILPFEIPFDRVQIEDFNDRLRQTRFYEPQMIVDDQLVNRSTYGFNRQTAEIVRNYFLTKFNWKETVADLNKYQHFKTNIAVSFSCRTR
jgi:hypothetical protein